MADAFGAHTRPLPGSRTLGPRPRLDNDGRPRCQGLQRGEPNVSRGPGHTTTSASASRAARVASIVDVSQNWTPAPAAPTLARSALLPRVVDGEQRKIEGVADRIEPVAVRHAESRPAEAGAATLRGELLDRIAVEPAALPLTYQAASTITRQIVSRGGRSSHENRARRPGTRCDERRTDVSLPSPRRWVAAWHANQR